MDDGPVGMRTHSWKQMQQRGSELLTVYANGQQHMQSLIITLLRAEGHEQAADFIISTFKENPDG